MINRFGKGIASGPHARAVAGTTVVNIVTTLVPTGWLLARLLGPTGRGDLAVVLSWPAMIGSMASVGISPATCYWVSKRPREARSMMWTAYRPCGNGGNA
jgi:O-antigen/teichoic acid export membrane protein